MGWCRVRWRPAAARPADPGVRFGGTRRREGARAPSLAPGPVRFDFDFDSGAGCCASGAGASQSESGVGLGVPAGASRRVSHAWPFSSFRFRLHWPCRCPVRAAGASVGCGCGVQCERRLWVRGAGCGSRVAVCGVWARTHADRRVRGVAGRPRGLSHRRPRYRNRNDETGSRPCAAADRRVGRATAGRQGRLSRHRNETTRPRVNPPARRLPRSAVRDCRSGGLGVPSSSDAHLTARSTRPARPVPVPEPDSDRRSPSGAVRLPARRRRAADDRRGRRAHPRRGPSRSGEPAGGGSTSAGQRHHAAPGARRARGGRRPRELPVVAADLQRVDPLAHPALA